MIVELFPDKHTEAETEAEAAQWAEREAFAKAVLLRAKSHFRAWPELSEAIETDSSGECVRISRDYFTNELIAETDDYCELARLDMGRRKP